MAITFNESGMNIQCNKRVSINRADSMNSEFCNKLDRASGVIERYAKSKDVNITFSQVKGGTPELISIDVQPANMCRKKVPFVSSTMTGEISPKSDKPFLREVYERIQLITEGTKPRIETMKAETLAKLRKIGKIK